MTIELGALELPLKATGRDAVLAALTDIDRAAAKTAAAGTIPLTTTGATAAVGQIQTIGAAVAGVRTAATLATRGIREELGQAIAGAGLDRQAATEAKKAAAALEAGLQSRIGELRGQLTTGLIDPTAFRAQGEAAVEGFITAVRAQIAGMPPITVPIAAPDATAAAAGLGAVEGAAQRVTQRMAEQQAQARATATALDGVRQRGQQAFERIALDVSQATADYRAGLIGLRDYRTALDTARQAAAQLRQEAGVLDGRQLAQFNRILNQTAESAGSARREGRGFANQWSNLGEVLTLTGTSARSGVSRVTSAVSQLGVMALGTRSAVASLATGTLMSLGVTAGTVLAVVAGLALIGIAFQRLTADGREASERTSEAIHRLADQAESDLPKATKLVRDLTAAFREQERVAGLRGTSPAFSFEGFVQFVSARLAAQAAGGDADAKKLSETWDRLFGVSKKAEDLAAAIKGGQAAMLKAALEESDQAIETLTKSIELRTADNHAVQVALTLMDQLKREAADEGTAPAERNKKQEQYNALLAAFETNAKAAAEARQHQIDGLRDEVAVLVESASQRALTTAEVDRLRSAYERVTAALDNKNNSDRQQLELLKAQRQALAELAQATSFTRTTKGSTFGQDLTLGRPKTPSLDNLTFGADQDRTADFFAGGALDTFTEQLERQTTAAGTRIRGAIDGVNGQIAQSLDEMRTRLAQGLTDSIVEGIAQGFEEGLASGNIGQGAAALTAALLAGLGTAAISFGVASLGIAQLMEAIKKALSSLNPALAIPAAIGLIALGGLLKGAASRMFSGASGGGSSSASGSVPANRDTTVRIIVGRDGEIVRREPVPATQTVSAAPTATRQAAAAGPRPVVTYSPVFIGKHDQKAQRELVEMVNLAYGRGVKVLTDAPRG